MSKLISTVSPHFRGRRTTQSIMLDVLIALVPAVIASVIFFGLRSLLVLVDCVAVSVAAEWGFEKLCKKENTLSDLSAVVTGVILALNLPVTIPLWQAALGSVIAIVVVKQLFGGIGQNFANPAPQAFCMMPDYVDAVSCATPLTMIAKGETASLPSYLDMFLGNMGGSMGETSALALLLGGIYLLARRVITWHTPVAFIGTVAVMSFVCGQDVLAQLLSGGLMIGAIFMATDYSSSPATKWGKIIYGVGCGLITILIRFWGNFPEGVSFALLIMCILTPYIEKLTRAKPLIGEAEK